MVMSRCACTASLLVQALSASTSNDRNIAELYGFGPGYSGAGSAVLAGVSGMLWSALLSSIEGRLFECVVGQFPLGEQRAIGAVRDQRIDRLQHRLLQRLFLDRQSDAGELLRDGLAHSRVGAGLEVHDVGQRLVALCRGIDAALPELGAGIGRAVVPTSWTGLVPQFFSLQAAICAGNMVRRLAPTFLPQSAAASLNSALRDCCTKNCGPLRK